jgi:hypothetical protein
MSTEKERVQQKRLKGLVEKVQAIGSECLDDLVHDLKSSEASSINNQGAHEQIDYIVMSLGAEEAIRKLEEILK